MFISKRLLVIDSETPAVLCLLPSVLCLLSSTTVVSALQIAHFMQNKPNFRKAQINVSRVSTKDYENKTLGERGKNKPNSNPIQTQSNPIKANKMPKQTQYKPNTKPNKANFKGKKMLLILTLLEVLANSVGRGYYLGQYGSLNKRRSP